MTKKHFIRMAEIIRAVLDGYGPTANITPHTQAECIAAAFIQLAREDNPRFDVDRFRRACGLEAK